MDEQYIGGTIFEGIEIDEGVTPDLKHCLRCIVRSKNKNGQIIELDYKIPLDAVGKGYMWQCPACERIYLLKDSL